MSSIKIQKVRSSAPKRSHKAVKVSVRETVRLNRSQRGAGTHALKVNVQPKKTSRANTRGKNPRVSIPGVMSSVSDGVNTGMVWRNSNSVRDFFAPRFEKVADLVSAGTAFAIIKQYYLNPGNTVLFPVFSQIAATYEEYINHRLRFWYRGEEYTASGTNLTAGVVTYATNMDPDDSSFSNNDQMENYEGSVNGPPFCGHFMHDVHTTHRARGLNKAKGNDLALNQYFVYSSANQAAPAASTAKFYDMGNFQVSSSNTQAATMGELWVEHSWTMIRRKQQTPLGQNLLSAHVSAAAAGTATTAAPLGTTGGLLRSGSTIPVVSTTNTFTLPSAGRFVVAVNYSGSISGAGSLGFGANITALTLLTNNTSAGVNSFNAGGIAWSLYIVDVSTAGTAAANTVTITGPTMSGGNTDVLISQLNGGFNLKPVSEDRLGRLEELVTSLFAKNNLSLVIDSDFDDDCKESSLTQSTVYRAVDEVLKTHSLKKKSGALP